MKTAGITAEYNPFHKGHVYHIERTRQLADADCVITVMSGDFTQRGEPAVCDKWDRAKAAISVGEAGPDLILELPFAFACSRASVFAAGAVDMLVKLGVDVISFGCEAEDPVALRKLAEVLAGEAETIGQGRAAHMKEGLSAAKAYELAVAEIAGEETAQLLLSPNNILAIEYLKRIRYWRGLGYGVEDLPIRRFGSGYEEASADTEFAGAGALRKMLREGADISRYVPAACDWEDPKALAAKNLQLLKGTVLRSTPEDLAHTCGVGEGLEHSIIREIRKAESMDALIAALTSKRYTASTIRRALTHILTGTSWEEAAVLTGRAPAAGRMLAAGERGRKLLRERDGNAFTIVTNMNKQEAELDPADRQLLQLDEKAADIYNLLCGRDIYAASDRVRSPHIR